MRTWSDLSAAEQEFIVTSARKLIGFVNWKTLAKRFDVGYDALRRRLDPIYRANANRVRALERQSQRGQRFHDHVPLERVDLRQLSRLKAAVPADTRSITGRIFGDPLPSRSALDRKRRRAARKFLDIPPREPEPCGGDGGQPLLATATRGAAVGRGREHA